MRIRYTLSMIDPVRLILQEIDKFACIEVGERHLVHRTVERVVCAPLNAIEHVRHLTTNGWFAVYEWQGSR